MRKKISLTVDERVVLHLMDFIPNEEDFEAPEGTTQAGIARGIGIERKHVPRAVKKLIAEDLVFTRVAHVKGGKQRKKVYFLSFEGKALARRLWENLSKKRVVLRDENGQEKETTFSELCFTFQVGKSPVQIYLELEDGYMYNPHKALRKTNSVPAGGVEKGPLPSAKDVYRNALKVAWEDSILTKEEAALLKGLRESLGLSEQDHMELQSEIIGQGLDDISGLNKKDIYKKILEVALRDGKITDDEQNILDELERILDLNDDVATTIKMEMKLLEGEGMLTEERRKRNYKDIYGSVIKESMKDGRISRDEQNIIILLKKLLKIEDNEHLEIFGELNRD
ncbi:MAG: hypothetical protein ACMUIE_08400 [Thermoplasmatota archaeon]